MFPLADIRDTRAWQEAHQEGEAEGMEKGREMTKKEIVHNYLAKGKSLQEIAEVLQVPLSEVQRLAEDCAETRIQEPT